MSCYFRPVQVRTARKVHRCDACYYNIAVGEHYKEQTGIWEGRAFRNRFRAECFDELCADGVFEFTHGDLDPPERLRATTPA